MKAIAAASSIMASNRCETKNLTFNGLKNEGRLTVLGPSAARPGLRAPPTPGFSPRIQTRCCNRRSWRGDENEELQSAAMAEQTTSVAGGGSRQRNNHKQGEDIYDVSVCVCVCTCSVASTSCQDVPSTAPWQWARFNRVRMHWMFLAVN